jgi:hypothetical protein
MSDGTLETTTDANDIPDEILATIFHLSRDATINPTSSRTSFIRDEFKVSHVCHRWRVVSIHTPLLWTSFRCLHSKWNAECLSRSGSAPISVDLSTTAEKDFVALEVILEQLPRVVNLTLDLSYRNPMYVKSLFSVYLTHPAQCLRSLNLKSLGPKNLPPCVPLFSGVCPNLRTVSFHTCSFDWTAVALDLRRLTHLEITNWMPGLNAARFAALMNGEDPSVEPPGTIDDVVHVLSRIPGLSTLKLCDSLPRSFEQWRSERKTKCKIIPSQLVSLTLCDCISSILSLLDNLVLPPQSLRQIRLSIFCPKRTTQLEDLLSDVFCFVEKYAAVRHPFEYLSLSDAGFMLKSNSVWDQDAHQFELKAVSTDLLFASSSLEQLVPFIRRLRMQSLKSIVIASTGSLDSIFWTALEAASSCCHTITLINIHFTSAFTFLRTLSKRLRSGPEMKATFPTLKHLVLLQTDFEAGSDIAERFDDALCDTLEQRSAEGFGIGRIEIVCPKCTPNQMYIDRLRAIVPSLSYSEISSSDA